MCGITGIFSFNPIGRMHLIHLEAATRALEKRGPDAHQTWFDEIAGLGHRRLSVIDTSEAANQPMQDATGRYHLVFNGEIYNYKAIRAELGGLGRTFITDSDTEVLLQAYIQWGKSCLEKLNGFFAFAIYDVEEKSIFLARDRFGIKPLYFLSDENKLLFASELKSLLAYNIPKQIDKESLHLYFQLTYIPAPRTIFQNVKKLGAGQMMMVSKGEVKIENYYQIPFQDTPSIGTFDQAKSKVKEALQQSVRKRLVADVPLGAFLSGGIDSSIIVALAAGEISNLKTFSVGFKDNKYFDETAYAQLVADKYKTDHHVFSLSNDDLLASVGSVLDYIDEPFADSSALPVFILSQLTRKHVTVALSGDGADEVFSGYNKHSAWLMSHESSNANRLISTLAPLWNILPKSRSNGFSDTVRKLDKFAKLLKLSDQEKYWFLASFVGDTKIENLIRPEWRKDDEVLSGFKASQMKGIKSGSINEVLLTDSQQVLEGDMLAKVDRMSMANALEVRVPFLDPEVVWLAFDMPEEYKISEKGRKIVLREAFRDMLPKELYSRPKQGFEVPLLGWFQNELGAQLDRMVFNQSRIEEQGIFHWEEIKRIKQKMISLDPGDVHIQIWSLLVFQNWYERFYQ